MSTIAERSFLELFADQSVTKIVVEHKDRAPRFGFRYLEVLLVGQGRSIEVVNLAENGKEDLLQDLTSIIYSMCARLYGQRRARRQTQTIVEHFAQEASRATGRADHHHPKRSSFCRD